MKSFVFVILIILFSLVSAQNPKWIAYQNGNKINSILFTEDKIWLGTEYAGVSVVDKISQKFIIYNTLNSLLPSNKINAIIMDSQGNKWIGTNKGLVKYDGSKWRIYNSSNSGLPSNIINCMLFNKERNLLLGTNSGIATLNLSTGFWSVMNQSNSALKSNIISAMKYDTLGNLWIGSHNVGLARYNENDSSKWKFFREIDGTLPSNYVADIVIDKYNNKWIATHRGVSVINKFSADDQLLHTVNESVGLSNDWTNCLSLGDSDNIWIGTLGGLSKFSISFSGNREHVVFDTLNSELPNGDVRAIYIDKNQNKWLGTGYGFSKLSGNNLDDQNWAHFKSSISGMKNYTVKKMIFDKKGVKWFGTNYGLYSFDGENWQFFDHNNSTLSDDNINSMAIDNEGILWLGTRSGVFSFDTKAKDISDFINYNISNSGMRSNLVSCLSTDASGVKWIGTKDAGVAKFDGSKWTIFKAYNSWLPEDKIIDIDIDKNNCIWISTYSSGIAKFDGYYWTIYDINNTPLETNNIIFTYIDFMDNKWIYARSINSNDNKIFMFDDTNWKVLEKTNSGYSGETIYDIFVDRANNLWVSTYPSILVQYDGNTWEKIVASYPSLQFSFVNSISNGEDGSIWFATKEGIFVYNEDGIDDISNDDAPLSNYELAQNYPNPFNPTTTISYSIPNSSLRVFKADNFVKLKVYDILGREVATLVNEGKPAGNYKVVFNADGLSSGVYFYKLSIANAVNIVKKMMLIK